MKIPNYSLRDMAIHTAADLTKDLKTPRPESPFQVRDYQLKPIRELSQIFNAETQMPNMDTLPTHPDPLTKKSYKLPRVEDQTSPPPRVDLDE